MPFKNFRLTFRVISSVEASGLAERCNLIRVNMYSSSVSLMYKIRFSNSVCLASRSAAVSKTASSRSLSAEYFCAVFFSSSSCSATARAYPVKHIMRSCPFARSSLLNAMIQQRSKPRSQDGISIELWPENFSSLLKMAN